MNSFKYLVLAKSIAAAFIATAGIAAPAISHASAAEGVTCDTQHAPQFVGGVLKCDKQSQETRNSVCLPTLTLNPISTDTCRIPNSPPEVPAVSVSFAEFLATDLVLKHDDPVRVPNNIARDSFNVTFHDFRFPEGAFLVGLPEKGVKCPNGATPVSSNGQRTLKCEAARENAICLGVYALKVRNGTDICVIEVNGFVVNQQPTVPSGQLLSNGWTLDIDGPAGGSNRDQWVKFVDAVAVGF